jgi:hypothetical protein
VLLDPFARDPGLVAVVLQHPPTTRASLIDAWDRTVAAVTASDGLDAELLATLRAEALQVLDPDAFLQLQAAHLMRDELAAARWAADTGRHHLTLAGRAAALQGPLAALDAAAVRAALGRVLRPTRRVVVAAKRP